MTDTDMNFSVELCMIICSSSRKAFNSDEVLRLLTTGADINFQDANRNFNTPLHLAVERRNINLIRLLLSFNPSFRIRNMIGERPRDLALNMSFFDVVKMLDEHREITRINHSPSGEESYTGNRESYDSGVSIEVQSASNTRNSTSYTSDRVKHMVSISKIDPHFKRTNFDMDGVKEIFARLDANVKLRPLLKISREIKSLEIYFLHDDQLNNEFSGCSITELTGTLFINGPQNGSAFEATLAHKLLHYAMNHVNDNDCKPYRRKQSEKMFRFKKIVTIYKRKIETLNPVVQRVFDLPDSLWDAELIACVPHFLAFHFNETATLSDITEAHKELFDFYYEVVLKDIDDYLVRSNLKKFKERPVEGSSFGRTTTFDPYKNERLDEKYGSNYRHNKRNNRDLERVCAIL